MLTQQMLNSNFAIGSFIVKHWRSHIFPHRNTRTGCLYSGQKLPEGGGALHEIRLAEMTLEMRTFNRLYESRKAS